MTKKMSLNDSANFWKHGGSFPGCGAPLLRRGGALGPCGALLPEHKHGAEQLPDANISKRMQSESGDACDTGEARLWTGLIPACVRIQLAFVGEVDLHFIRIFFFW